MIIALSVCFFVAMALILAVWWDERPRPASWTYKRLNGMR